MMAMNPFEYNSNPTEEQKAAMEAARGMFGEVYKILDMLPPNRSLALAKTKLEEAAMWANKGISHGE